MRIRNYREHRALHIMVFLLLVLTIAGGDSVFANDSPLPSEINFGVAVPPTPVEPSGTYWTNDLQYRWTVVAGATDYQYRVWDGGVKMWEKKVSATACDASYCTDFPTDLDLIDGAYKWTVRAYVNGVWSDWANLQWYSIKAGFNSQFASDAAGWQPTYGAWTWDVKWGHYRTTGLYTLCSTTRFDQVYGKYTYEVKFRRQGTQMGDAFGVLFNGQPWPLSTGKGWHTGYGFYINRQGEYAVFRYDSGVAAPLVNWTDSGGLIQSGWYNKLKVTYNKSTGYTQLFINDTRVYDGILNTYKWGNVGITMQKSSTGWELLKTLWAKLTIYAPSSAAEAAAAEVFYIDEAKVMPMPGDDTGH